MSDAAGTRAASPVKSSHSKSSEERHRKGGSKIKGLKRTLGGRGASSRPRSGDISPECLSPARDETGQERPAEPTSTMSSNMSESISSIHDSCAEELPILSRRKSKVVSSTDSFPGIPMFVVEHPTEDSSSKQKTSLKAQRTTHESETFPGIPLRVVEEAAVDPAKQHKAPQKGTETFPGIPLRVVEEDAAANSAKQKMMNKAPQKATETFPGIPLRVVEEDGGKTAAQQEAFPGIPLRVVKPKKYAPEAKSLKAYSDQLKKVRQALRKAHEAEMDVKSRVFGLQMREEELKRREQELLNSCESLSGLTSHRRRGGRKALPGSYRPEEVRYFEKLGSGGSGSTVYNAMVDGWMCACKEIQLNHCGVAQTKAFEKEMALYYQLPSHPNVVRYLFHEVDKSTMRLYMSLYSESLGQALAKHRETGQLFQEEEIFHIARCVADGLLFLHQNNIIHRDVKADNIFLRYDAMGRVAAVALGDFDTAKRLGATKKAHSVIGSPTHMAPELLNWRAEAEPEYDLSVDVYSFGVFLFELITCQQPYKEYQTALEMMDAIRNGVRPHIDADVQEHFGPELFRLFLQCTEQESSKRIPMRVCARRLGHLDSSKREPSVGPEEPSSPSGKGRKKAQKRRLGGRTKKKLVEEEVDALAVALPSAPENRHSQLSSSSMNSQKSLLDDVESPSASDRDSAEGTPERRSADSGEGSAADSDGPAMSHGREEKDRRSVIVEEKGDCDRGEENDEMELHREEMMTLDEEIAELEKRLMALDELMEETELEDGS